MPRIGQGQRAAMEASLAASADRAGNADGVASENELQQLVTRLGEKALPVFDLDATERRETAAALLGKIDGEGLETLAPELRTLPAPLRRLALEVDALWGNVDGELSVQEIDRVAQYYLSSLPFFTEDASMLVELAEHLGFAPVSESVAGVGAKASSVLSLQLALHQVDTAQGDAARPFRELFDEALQASEVPGAPELLRDAATHSPKWHRLSILEHTAMTVRAAYSLSEAVGADWLDAGATMLLHDVGKILERHVRDVPAHSAFHFYDHEAEGAKWLEARGIPEEIRFHIHNHAVLRKSTVDEMVELAGGDMERLGKMVLVYCSDQLGKGDTPDQVASFDQQKDKIKTLADMAGLDGEHLLNTVETLRAEWYPYVGTIE